MKIKCHWCEKEVEKFHRDHVIPVYVGGKTKEDNIVLSCPKCNLSKNRNIWVKTEFGIAEYKKPVRIIKIENDGKTETYTICYQYTRKIKKYRQV